jgi:hypothetical protein
MSTLPGKGRRKFIKSKIVGPYIPYGLFQRKGEMYAKFGSDWSRNVNFYKAQTYIHTKIFRFIYT